MCGFMGRIGEGFHAERALPWLRRRGPDSQNTWHTDDGAVNLLHCRLSIVDEDSRSDQPFRDPTHGIVVVLNGEIYNYRSLQCHYADFAFCTESDTEVIVAAYVKDGIAGFNRLHGMFSFVLVDERRGRVVLARDAVGKKPLFTFSVPGSLLFGSSVLPLIACSGSEPSIDADAAAFFWRRGYISPDVSAVTGIRPVPPGAVLEFDERGNELSRTRIGTEIPVLYRGESAAEIKSTIHDLLAQAVEYRLENNPHPMALLSGGIDSTLITQLTAEHLKRGGDDRNLKVVTLGSMIPYTQDEYYARYAAKRLGLDLELVRPGRQRLPDAVRHAVSLQDEPLGMPSYFFLFQLIEAAAPHGKVLLTGDGGDEVFLGYRPAADWRSHELAPGDESSLVRVGPGESPWMASWARDVTGNTLLGHMLTKVDRASAEQGVEIRCPLLDLSLMSYVRSLPQEILCGRLPLKYLLKQQLEGWPAWFLERPKLGFAYNLRWHWALTRFGGLREMVLPDAIATFGDRVPPPLRAAPAAWRTADIFQHFGDAWRLMVWSAFLIRLAEATRMSRTTARSGEIAQRTVVSA
ncbi:MAG: asparagine synthase-related protein [Xanthobacteraceae bacterium]